MGGKKVKLAEVEEEQHKEGATTSARKASEIELECVNGLHDEQERYNIRITGWK